MYSIFYTYLTSDNATVPQGYRVVASVALSQKLHQVVILNLFQNHGFSSIQSIFV